MTPRIYTIKVGSQQFTIDFESLNRYPDCTLSKTLTFNITNGKEKDVLNYDFRSPDLFPVVLELIASGKLKVPEGVSYKDLKEELDFWGFELEIPVIQRSTHYAPRDTVSTGPMSLQCPWGIYAKELSQCCWMPLACFVWKGLISNSILLDVVAVGYRDINVYIKHSVGDDNIGISLLMSHRHFLERLAELSSCQLTFMDGVYGHNVISESRCQDMFCDNNLSVHQWLYVKEFRLSTTTKRKRNNVVFTATAAYHFNFDWKGFTIGIDVEGSTLYWKCTVDVPSEDPIHLADLNGFLLRLSFVVNKTVFEGVIVPSINSRFVNLSFNIYHSFTYSTSDADWYRQLGLYSPTKIPPGDLINDTQDVLLLIEEAPYGILNLSRITRDTDFVHGAFYERINIFFN